VQAEPLPDRRERVPTICGSTMVYALLRTHLNFASELPSKMHMLATDIAAMIMNKFMIADHTTSACLKV
jgi:hypothetical protein